MLAWVTQKIWPYLAIAGLTVLYVFSIRSNGRLEERLKQAERKSDAQARMRDAAARTPTDRGSVVDRLHNGRF